MTLRCFQGAWLLSCVPGQPPVEHGAVVIDAGQRVVRVGEAVTLRAEFPHAAFSLEPSILLPGLVNAHTHLELSALRGHTRSGGGFGPWVQSMTQARSALLPEQDGEAIDAAVSDLLRAGTVAVGEVTNSLASVDSLATAPLLGRVFHEVFGLRRETADVMRALSAQARVAREPWPRNLSYAPAPHALYSLHPQSAQQIVAEARAAGERTSLHLGEHAAERAFLRDGSGPFADFLSARGVDAADFEPPGLSPVEHAARLGLLAPDVIAVHLTACTREELRRVAHAGASTVLCPRSNLFIELMLPPLYDILDAGLTPGLGSDSLASNTTLDVLAEAATLRDRFPDVSPLRLLELATWYGAVALGLSHRVGALCEGLSPGLVAIVLRDDEVARVRDPAAHILRFPTAKRRVLVRPARPTLERPLGEPA